MKLLQTLLFLLVLIGSVLPRKVASVKKDASEIKFIPTIPPEDRKEISRISRQSSQLYTPTGNVKYQYQLIPVSVHSNGGDGAENEGNEAHYVTQHVQEHYQNLPQKQQEQILAAIRASKQPKSPVYHATPLEPYGALLKHSPGTQYEEKTILVTPKPIVEHHQGDSNGGQEEEAAGGHAYYTSNNAVGKLTEAVISEPKHAPLVYKTHHHHHQTLHHHDEHEEPKNYAAKYQFGYQVRDPKHGTFFGHSEARDGHHTKGHYHVLLPDGRLQNVQYWADLSGYHAQVSYNAAAKHPTGHQHQHH
ncbi:uncharacterized protein [Periplaneta americana]|uniref:uncharacterized protein n=1 Tax=Periplaneta americana TaxID=6978 RepID=UPI0037E982CC